MRNNTSKVEENIQVSISEKEREFLLKTKKL